MFPGYGTLLNALLILLGSLVGLRLSSLLPQKYRLAVMHAIALFTLLIGVNLVSENKPELLKVFFNLIMGATVGHLLSLEERLEKLTLSSGELSRGFVSSSLLFTVGPMTLMGCILEGAKGDSSIILSKAIMDGFSSLILSSSMGKGVVFSSLYVLIFQGTITLLAFLFGDFLNEQALSNTLFLGGGLMILVALKMLNLLGEFSVLNLLPALLLTLFI